MLSAPMQEHFKLDDFTGKASEIDFNDDFKGNIITAYPFDDNKNDDLESGINDIVMGSSLVEEDERTDYLEPTKPIADE